ncbi:carbohydrate esterase family 4 protein [Tilletiaria anomala UBC 951]|uniref:Carbohydrate esterase family 4 protein n=1 Tax=Tilletiaria anomala (strain ATCC 24038 / CBS 436.72 / UBC 951) TaxID=1037660 RepID=A0A066WHZ4_TILAU|nr:carbohydrate esterase family 4 protein [Tilletiaria anomala UBC 951]KDN53637.1 carbohydrate esterase family 4 protein [Tilletiaria anomala UBC 951]
MLTSLRNVFLSSVIALTFLSSSSATPLEGLATRTPRVPVYDTCNSDGKIALTFDDGPWKYEPKLLNELQNAGAKASFFLNGNNYGCIYDYADEIRRAFDAGHLIGSHTWSHADITKLSTSELDQELGKLERAMIKILGVRPRVFRPPYGSINTESREVLARRGYTAIILWDRDTKDADGATVAYSRNVMNKVMNSYPKSHMVLSHETIKTTSYNVMPHALPMLQQKGYELVTAMECVGSGSDDGQWYDYVQQPEDKNDSWKC